MKALKLFSIAAIAVIAFSCEEKPEPGPTEKATIELTTKPVTSITAETAVSGGNITKEGESPISQRGICWSETENPNLNSNNTKDGTGVGEFTSTITGLEPGKSYYVRAYAVNNEGVAYGDQQSFSVPVFAPKVGTLAASNVTNESFTISGEIISSMGGTVTEAGFCIGDDPSPETKFPVADFAKAFTLDYTGAQFEHKYYIRAYAINEAGIGYGEQIEVTTSPDPDIQITDASLAAILIANYDTNADGKITLSEADGVVELIVEDAGVQSLSGLEQFRNLKKIVATSNPIARLVLDGSSSIEEINIAFGTVPLREVSLTNLPALKVLFLNDGAYLEDGTSTAITSLTLDLPALEILNINCWHSLQNLDINKCTALREFYGCQLFNLKAVDFSGLTNLEFCYIPDIFVAEDFKVNSDKLWYLGAWNANKLTSMNLSSCHNLKEIDIRWGFEIGTLTLDCAGTLEKLNMECLRKLTSLNLKDYSKLSFLDAIQLYVCETITLPDDCSHLAFCWIADALAIKELTFTNLPEGARVLMWGNPALETLNYSTNQKVIGWNYGDNPDVVSDENAVPGENLKHFNITAPQATKLWMNCAHGLLELDLSKCPKLEEFRGHQLHNVNSAVFPESIRFIYMPEAYAMTSFDLSPYKNLEQFQAWFWTAATEFTFNNPKLWELNIGFANLVKTLDVSSCTALQYLFINNFQSLESLNTNGCKELLIFEGQQMFKLPSISFAGTSKLTRIYLPDALVLTSVSLTGCSSLNTIQMWNAQALETLDLSECADNINELNADICPKLATIYLRTGQTYNTWLPSNATIQYK